jgi:hypothetical protein
MPFKPDVRNGQLINLLSSALRYGSSSLSDVPKLVKRVLQEEMWSSFVVEQTGEIAENQTFAEFVTRKPLEGLGSDVKTIQRMCADDAETLDLIDEVIQNPHGIHVDVNNINVTRPQGTSRQNALRSLRKNAPSIHREVITGRLSAHAGMIKAGLRKRTVTVPLEPQAAARALKRAFNRAEVNMLIKALSND